MRYPTAPLEAPPSLADATRIHRRQLATIINQVQDGKLNALTTVTLAASATSTTLQDPRLGPFSVLFFCPQTESAASVVSDLWVPTATQAKGSAVIQHPSVPATDMTFGVLIIG
jgi:hypothetical protein